MEYFVSQLPNSFSKGEDTSDSKRGTKNALVKYFERASLSGVEECPDADAASKSVNDSKSKPTIFGAARDKLAVEIKKTPISLRDTFPDSYFVGIDYRRCLIEGANWCRCRCLFHFIVYDDKLPNTYKGKPDGLAG